jgi:hypothetical protein
MQIESRTWILGVGKLILNCISSVAKDMKSGGRQLAMDDSGQNEIIVISKLFPEIKV